MSYFVNIEAIYNQFSREAQALCPLLRKLILKSIFDLFFTAEPEKKAREIWRWIQNLALRIEKRLSLVKKRS